MGLYEKILVVDDAPEVLILMKRVLAKESVEVISATNGLEAVQALHTHQDIKLIFIDAMMPGMDGYQTMQVLASDFSHREFKVCFLTSQRSSESVKRAITLGADDYLVKPIDLSLVVKKCSDLLEKTSVLEGFATAHVDIPLVIPKLPVVVDIKMVKISEIGAEIHSNVQFKEGAMIEIYSNVLPHTMKVDEFTVKFKIKKVVAWQGKYTIEGVFVVSREKPKKLSAPSPLLPMVGMQKVA